MPGSGPDDFHSPVYTTATPINKGAFCSYIASAVLPQASGSVSQIIAEKEM